MTMPRFLLCLVLADALFWIGAFSVTGWLMVTGLGLAFTAFGLWVQYDRKTYGNE